MVNLSLPVGIRNGVTMMPNQSGDINKVTSLLDRIPSTNGGTADVAGAWSSDRTQLIIDVTAAITAFQIANSRPVIDGVVDPGGGTLRLMNQLAGPAAVVATVVDDDGGTTKSLYVADADSVDGSGDLVPLRIGATFTSKLVSVDGTSIKWFGVVVPTDTVGGIVGGTPHIFFTPSPWQGGYQDPGYDDFSSWRRLWTTYSAYMGLQMIAAGAQQILVIPFYKNSQTGNLGDFLGNWRQAVSAAVGAVINSIDPLYLRDQYNFDSICTSSFSNGITTQQNFVASGDGVDGMRSLSFDMDGQAAGSLWQPSRGIAYSNTAAPHGVNPAGRRWYVGGRFGQMRPVCGPQPSGDHSLCARLLFHGLSRFA